MPPRDPVKRSMTMRRVDLRAWTYLARQRDLVVWLHRILGRDLGAVGEAEFHQVILDGDILCAVANTLAPNSVANYHATPTVNQFRVENVTRAIASLSASCKIPEAVQAQATDVLEEGRENVCTMHRGAGKLLLTWFNLPICLFLHVLLVLLRTLSPSQIPKVVLFLTYCAEQAVEQGLTAVELVKADAGAAKDVYFSDEQLQLAQAALTTAGLRDRFEAGVAGSGFEGEGEVAPKAKAKPGRVSVAEAFLEGVPPPPPGRSKPSLSGRVSVASMVPAVSDDEDDDTVLLLSGKNVDHSAVEDMIVEEEKPKGAAAGAWWLIGLGLLGLLGLVLAMGSLAYSASVANAIELTTTQCSSSICARTSPCGHST